MTRFRKRRRKKIPKKQTAMLRNETNAGLFEIEG
jgi:hypothetical protein